MTDAPTPEILVVDDEDVIVSLVKECLTEEGYSVSVAGNGSQAEELLRQKSFDLLISDIRMPDFDGIELLRRAKKLHPALGAIFMTGYADVESAKDAITEGALDYLRKPFNIGEIRSSVARALGKLSRLDTRSAQVELDRMSSLTHMMQDVSDLQSLMRMSLGFALLQCDFTCGAALYWSPSRNALARISTDRGDTSGAQPTLVRFSANPLESLAREFPELEQDYFVSESVDLHPLFVSTADERVRELLTPDWLKQDDLLVNFLIRRGDRLCGFLLVPVKPHKIAELRSRFKSITLTANQTALSVENLILLEDSRRAYRKLQDLQDKAIKLETMAARGEIAAQIGHEMKNFLGVVYGNLSLLDTYLKRGAFDGLPKYVEAIADNLDKMKNFTADLMREGKIKRVRKRIAIGEQIEELINYMRPQKRFSGVRIDFISADCDIRLDTDPQLFQQLMYNILNNAADACRRRPEPLIRLALSEDRSAQTCAVSITDNGCGVNTDLLGVNFDRKYTSKKDGHGLGLMVCKRIMDSHRGRFQIDSLPGEGATVILTFPLTDDSLRETKERPQKSHASTSS